VTPATIEESRKFLNEADPFKGAGAKDLKDREKDSPFIECPRCKQKKLHPEKVMNALSRRDNKTYICSDCGTAEAMFDYIQHRSRNK
jgi:DNA-directed RNA polymerase subunit RPC12/RpoP